MPGDTSDYAAIATPVTSAQVAKAWVRPDRRVAAVLWSRRRVFGIALGYEDLIDHDQLRHDPVMAVLGGKLGARRADCAPLAGKSTLNRLKLSRAAPSRYHKISYDAAAIEGLFVDPFLDA